MIVLVNYVQERHAGSFSEPEKQKNTSSTCGPFAALMHMGI
jgi:hypothetical protein